MTLCVVPPQGIHTPTKSGGDRHCGSGYVMAFVYQMISEDHVTKVPSNISNIMVRSHSSLVTSLPSLVVISTLLVEI